MHTISQNLPNVITINDAEVTQLVYKDQPVVTFNMIDQVHSRASGTARKRFNDNRVRFIEGDDFYQLSYQEVKSLSEFRTAGITPNSQGLTIFTESGYLMLVKSFTDDLAWQVQRELVNKYFAPQTPLQSQMLEYARINKELMALFGIDGNMQTLALNNAMQKEFGVNLLETWDLNGLKSEQQQQTLTVSDIAKQLGIGTRKINPVLIEAELQSSHRDHKDRLYYELTDKGLEYAIYLDTGKKHSDGTPIRQIKWYDSVVEILKGYLQYPRGCF